VAGFVDGGRGRGGPNEVEGFGGGGRRGAKNVLGCDEGMDELNRVYEFVGGNGRCG